MKCPKCNNTKEFQSPKISYAIPAWLTVGLPSVHRAYYRKKYVQCSECMHIFPRKRLPQAPVAIFSMWIIGIISTLVILSLLFSNLPKFVNFIPDFLLIQVIEGFIKNNIKIVSISIALFFVSVFPICIVSYFISNYIFRSKVRKKL